MADEKEVNTGGGAYIGGSVHVTRGDFVNRDKLTLNVSPTQGITWEQFLALLGQIKEALPQAGLEADVQDVIEGDFEVVEEQAQKEKPSLPVITTKLESITKLLTAAGGMAAAAQGLAPMLQKAAEWASQLIR